MSLFTKESLEKLRERIDLVEVLSPHIELKRAGASYKALCPFHEEKSPSFVVQRGDSHYHCFGCGAHGDALAFLMEHQHLSFVEAVEVLAEKFHVPVERAEKGEKRGISRVRLREALECASLFFHAYLLHTPEGHAALAYLYERRFSLSFIRRFCIGFAPTDGSLFRKCMAEKKFQDLELIEAGLLSKERQMPFFRARITFLIKSASGSVIGFSARKIKEETFGGKYINTPETALFKKSKLLFGLDVSRREIAKKRFALIVEGQIDCLKLIDAGLDTTVAALGTAFGPGHVSELKNLGVMQVVLIFDSDKAGEEAAYKTGNLFQSVGIEVKVVHLPTGYDPDTFLIRFGVQKLKKHIQSASDYLRFAVHHLGAKLNPDTPAGKNALVRELTTQIRTWEEPVMVHESLRKIASLLAVPEEVVGVTHISSQASPPSSKPTHPLNASIDPNKILELDLLRWLMLVGEENPSLVELATAHLTSEHFLHPLCRSVFDAIVSAHNDQKSCDPLSLFAQIQDENLAPIIEEIMQKKINRERAEPQLKQTVQKLMDRKWMQEREKIKIQIHSGKHSEEEVLELAKQFDALQKERKVL